MKQNKLDQFLEEGPLSFSLDIKKVEKKDYVIKRSFSDVDLLAVKDALDLVALVAFSFELLIKSGKKKSFQLEGVLKAKGAQASVVDCSPVDFEIDEPFEIEFIRAVEPTTDETNPLEEIYVDVEDHVKDVHDGETLALGAAVYQQFMVALDPYPRRNGQTFDWEDDDDGSDHPFAGLKQIYPKQSN